MELRIWDKGELNICSKNPKAVVQFELLWDYIELAKKKGQNIYCIFMKYDRTF